MGLLIFVFYFHLPPTTPDSMPHSFTPLKIRK
jgi:hypothetical protein